ncbi:hypothetical protein BHM03_00020971 [Ensete ventricosum]|nr:hypothetical protein BHM03_00020971 [Ensete ventricosum]
MLSRRLPWSGRDPRVQEHEIDLYDRIEPIFVAEDRSRPEKGGTKGGFGLWKGRDQLELQLAFEEALAS